MTSVSREFHFCAAHRLLGYDGPCANIHGHNYRVVVHARKRDGLLVGWLDEMGMVVDFKELKVIQKWIDEHWDHKLLLHKDSTPLDTPEDGVLVFWFTSNPTAENMAQLLLDFFAHRFANVMVEIFKVQVWETPKCCAEVTLD